MTNIVSSKDSLSLIKCFIEALKRHGMQLAALTALGAVLGAWAWQVLPQKFTSRAYLFLTEAPGDLHPRVAETLIRSPAVLGALAEGEPALGQTPEARLAKLNDAVSINLPSGESRKTSRVYILSVDGQTPVIAQRRAVAIIEKWIEVTKPRPERLKELQSQLERLESQSVAVSTLLQRMDKEAATLVLPSALTGQIATPIAELSRQKFLLDDEIAKLKSAIRGVTADVMLAPPSLPTEPNRFGRAMSALLTALAVFCLGLGALAVRASASYAAGARICYRA